MFVFKLKIICIGKLKEKAFVELEKEYIKRLSPFTKLKIVEISEVSYRENEDFERVKEKEAQLVIKQIDKNALVVLLSENGIERNSKDFATFLGRIKDLGQEITFVIGGSLGLHASLKEVSNHVVSLSKLTFTHNFARVLLEEQIYRACTILSKKNYHK